MNKIDIENTTLEEDVVALLIEKSYTMTTAESCSGGLLAGRVLNVSGASSVYEEGYITYSNHAKEKLLHVRNETLELYGAVSSQTAKEMAAGVAKAADAEVGLSVTGIAGPKGGTTDKPVGLVYIGCSVNGKVTVQEFHFSGTREENRAAAVTNALLMLKDRLSEL